MFIKKPLITSTLFFAFLSTAFGGTEDWVGNFSVQGRDGNTYAVIHNPQRIRFLYIASQHFTFTKGSKFNDLVASDNGTLDSGMDVNTFMGELRKLGPIVGKEINLGPTYPA